MHDDPDDVAFSLKFIDILDFSMPANGSNARIAALKESGLFAPQSLIPLQLSGHPLLSLLDEYGGCDLSSEENQLLLPVSQTLAAQLDCPRYTETPIQSYVDGVGAQMQKLLLSPVGSVAANGDEAATKRLMGQVRQLQKYLKTGLLSRRLHVSDK